MILDMDTEQRDINAINKTKETIAYFPVIIQAPLSKV